MNSDILNSNSVLPITSLPTGNLRPFNPSSRAPGYAKSKLEGYKMVHVNRQCNMVYSQGNAAVQKPALKEMLQKFDKQYKLPGKTLKIFPKQQLIPNLYYYY